MIRSPFGIPSMKLRERVVEAELALVDELQDRGGGERLGDARDADVVGNRHRRAGFEIALCRRPHQSSAARNPYPDIEPGQAFVDHGLLDDGGQRRPVGVREFLACRGGSDGDPGASDKRKATATRTVVRANIGTILPAKAAPGDGAASV